MFEARLPARKFRNYVCVGRHVSDEKVVGERDGVAQERKSAAETVWTERKAEAEATVHAK
ncbi:hypothetical protein PMIN03_011683 [Paraphaeosphaeria minitans]